MAIIKGTTINDTLPSLEDVLEDSGNLVLGLAGDDVIDVISGTGNNTLSGGLGEDEILAFRFDHAFGDQGDDELISDPQDDVESENLLFGGAGDDNITPYRNDSVSGGSGNDTIFAGEGGNTIRGGFGNDVFWLVNGELPQSANIITDFNPEEDTLKVNVAEIPSLDDLSIQQQGTDVVISAKSQPEEALAIIQNTTVENLNDTNLVVGDAANNSGTSSLNQEPLMVKGITFIGQDTLDETDFEGTTFAGISGIAFDPFQQVYYAASDDRIQPRFYTLEIDLEDGGLDDGDVNITDVTTLLDDNGDTFADFTLEPEAIAFSDDGSVFIASEEEEDSTFIKEFSLAGGELMNLPFPDKFAADITNNLGLKSLTLTPDERYLFVATENDDDQEASTSQGSPVRILKYDLTGDIPEIAGEFLYYTDPLATGADGDDSDTSGLVELVAVDNAGTLLALERSFIYQEGFNNKLFQINVTESTTDISNISELTDDINAVEKELLLDFAQAGIPVNTLGDNLGISAADLEATLGESAEEFLSTFGIAVDNLDSSFGISAENLASTLGFSLDDIQTTSGITIKDLEDLAPTLSLEISIDDSGLKALGLPLEQSKSTIGISFEKLASFSSNFNATQLETLLSEKSQNLIELDDLVSELESSFGVTGNELVSTLLEIPVDNFEAMTLGPVLPNGKRSLTLVSDNRFASSDLQKTNFLSFELDIEPEVVETGNPDDDTDGDTTGETTGFFELNESSGIFQTLTQTFVQISITAQNTSFSNELILFAVDNPEGNIGDISPDDNDGYLNAILNDNNRILSVLSILSSNNPSGLPSGFDFSSLTRTLELIEGQQLGFMLIQNGTFDEVKAGVERQVFFSSVSSFEIVNFTSTGFTLNIDDDANGVFDGLSIEIKGFDPLNKPPGQAKKLLGLQTGREVLDLRNENVDTLTGQITVSSEAAFDNFVGLYITNESGDVVDNQGNIIATVGSNNYVQSVMEHRLDISITRNTSAEFTLPGRVIVSPFMIADGTPDDFNPNEVFFPVLGANADGVDHFRLLDDYTFGVEDIFGGGDLDYDDMIVSINVF
ncbi:MAG: esterase-like activity of phytase family protein [Nostocaceae cyanobacterium]|nr:esterase-like activity of phytase family protein [Nostocaceae cyanobacterium]